MEQKKNGLIAYMKQGIDHDNGDTPFTLFCNAEEVDFSSDAMVQNFASLLDDDILQVALQAAEGFEHENRDDDEYVAPQLQCYFHEGGFRFFCEAYPGFGEFIEIRGEVRVEEGPRLDQIMYLMMALGVYNAFNFRFII